MKTNLQQNNERKELKYTLYINAIGKKSNAIMDEVRKAYPWLSNPKILKTNYGPFMARKYSYLLSPKDFYEVRKFIHNRAVYGHKGEIHYLIEDKQNTFIIDRVNY